MLRYTINHVHIQPNLELDKYVAKKIAKLDKYIPKRSRESAHAEVFLKESKIKTKKQCSCEVIVHLPHEELAVEETTINIFASVDIVEAKLKNQLVKYKQKHTAKPRILSLLKHAQRKHQ